MSFRETVAITALALFLEVACGSQVLAKDGPERAPSPMVTICHKPGTPAEQTMMINLNALGAHLGHGDLEGPCVLIDVHNHLPRGVSVDHLVSLINEAGVAMVVLMPVFYGANDPNGQGIDENLVLDFYRQQPDRIILFLGMQRPVLLNVNRWQYPDVPAENLLRFTENQLRTGLFRGMGEFIIRHYPYSLRDGEAVGGEVTIAADTPLMRRFLDLAVAYDVPVTIHYEVDSESLASLLSMLEYGRQATIILAHNCGRPDPETLRALLERYPNLNCDLGGMTPRGLYGSLTPRGGQQPKNPLDDGQGHLRPEWRVLFEQYPNRFVGIGTDLAHPDVWENRGSYTDQIKIFRSWLSDLSLGTAQHIAFQNARKLFKLNMHLICHEPGGHSERGIWVDADSISAHLQHVDRLGGC